jgi:hypothetical protein
MLMKQVIWAGLSALLLLTVISSSDGVDALSIDMNPSGRDMSNEVSPSYASLMIEYGRIRDVFSLSLNHSYLPGAFSESMIKENTLRIIDLMGAPFGSNKTSIIMRLGGNSANDIFWYKTQWPELKNKDAIAIGASDLQMINT